MRRALVLSGGGAKGAFELGALEYIKENKPSFFDFRIIAGVSVGSLNAIMLAQDKFTELQKLWTEISNNKVYTGSMPKNILQYLWLVIRVLFGDRSILGIKPLIQQIRNYVDLADVKVDYRCGFVSLTTGEYVPCKHTAFGNDNENFRKAILASSTMPLIWTPVDEIRIGTEIYKQLVDGGVRNVSPLKDVIVDNPDEIIIINCSTKKLNEETDAGNTIFKIAERSLVDITINEIFKGDIEEFVKTNEIVKQCKEKGFVVYRDSDHTEPYEYFNAIIIEPEIDLGDPLDFSTGKIKERRKAGWDAAEAAFKKYESSLGPTTVRSYKPTT
ncbi:MAG TPA: patatin-like phospholipase family protein [Chitinophagaceae bacterium]|jgi:NTE family protein|nr:patatin-like phospholipase family protein [Chitinophagaceae bacterium]